MAYSKKVVDKFENTLNDPKAFNVGRFDPKEENVGTGMVGAPACGDVMKLQIKCEPSGNTHVIKDVKFKTYGCGSAIASSSMFVDLLKGKTIEEAKLIRDKDIAEVLELPPIKLHCSVLAEESIKKALEDWENKNV
jgi:nitrogen fixation NifU-like protein